MKRLTSVVVGLAVLLAGCAGMSATGVLNGLQAMTATSGVACQQGLLPESYCKYVALAWLAEQQLAAAYDLNLKSPSQETKSALDAATKAAAEAKKNLESAPK